jgi:Flp pilus assembly pilin Flp
MRPFAGSPRVTAMDTVLQQLVRQREGQDLIEYGLLLGIITVASVLAIASIGTKVTAYLTSLNGVLP